MCDLGSGWPLWALEGTVIEVQRCRLCSRLAEMLQSWRLRKGGLLRSWEKDSLEGLSGALSCQGTWSWVPRKGKEANTQRGAHTGNPQAVVGLQSSGFLCLGILGCSAVGHSRKSCPQEREGARTPGKDTCPRGVF